MKHLRVFENFDKQDDKFDIENVMPTNVIFWVK